jgi:copper chaperone CopZ
MSSMVNTVIRNRSVVAATGLAAALIVGLSGCASSAGGMEPDYEENAIVHTVSDEDRALAASKDALPEGPTVLWVNGLGCPQCASNIDLQLKRVRGVRDVRVDLSVGKVTLNVAGASRPSPARLGDAVADAGFTLVKIEVGAPATAPAPTAPAAAGGQASATTAAAR